MDKILFKDYYFLLGIPNNASEEKIKIALDNLEGKRSPILLYEMKMILLNKELKVLYDQEYKLYSEASSKQNYEIHNPELRKFLEDTMTQENISINYVTENIIVEDNNRSVIRKNMIWIICGLIFLLFKMCS